MATNKYKKELKEAIKELLELKEHPLAMHIAIATSEYPQIDNISDKELVYLLKKYLTCQELDLHPHTSNYEDVLGEDLEEEDEYGY